MGMHVLCVYPTLVRTEMFTPEVLARMPDAAATFIEADEFARRTLRACTSSDVLGLFGRFS